MISCQDKAAYEGKHRNIGASLDVDLIGGAGSSLSLNGSKTNLSSDYAAVG